MIVPTGAVRGSCESFFFPFVLGGLGDSPSRRGKIHLFFLNTPFLFFLGDPYVTWYTFSKLFCAPPPSLLDLFFWWFAKDYSPVSISRDVKPLSNFTFVDTACVFKMMYDT